MSRWISLLRVYETWEEERILDKEDRRIVAHEIPDTLLGVEFYGESTWISKNKKQRECNKQTDSN